MKFGLKLFFCSLAIASCLFADQALTNQRVAELAHSGITAAELQRLIETAPSVNFLLTPAATDALLQAGVSEDTIKAMAARENGLVAVTNVAPVPKAIAPGTPSAATRTGENPGFGPMSRVEVFTGYSYLNVDTNGLTSRQSLNGFETSASVNMARHFAVEGTFSTYFKNNVLGSIVNAHDLSVLGGPRFNFGQGFVHALVGFDRLTGSALGISASQTGFASAFGGGIQTRPFAGHYAFRTSADYVLSQHNVFSTDAYNQNNFRISGGIVFVFGPPVLR